MASRHAKRGRRWSGSWRQRPRNLLTPGSVANLGFDSGALDGVGASGETHRPNRNRRSPASGTRGRSRFSRSGSPAKAVPGLVSGHAFLRQGPLVLPEDVGKTFGVDVVEPRPRCSQPMRASTPPHRSCRGVQSAGSAVWNFRSLRPVSGGFRAPNAVRRYFPVVPLH